MLESILVTLFCCLPLGIVGIINASKVSSLFATCDVEGANKASADAGKWTKIGAIIGAIGIVLYAIFSFVFASAVASL